MKQKNNISALCFCACVLMCINFNACTKQSFNTSKHTQKVIQTNAASILSIEGIADVFFVEDSLDFCIISGTEAIVDAVSITQTNNCITMSNTTKWYATKNYEKPQVYIHASCVDTVYIHEACNFSTIKPITRCMYMYMNAYVSSISVEIDAPSFLFTTWNKAGGEFEFYGTCTTARMQAAYTSKINAENLKTKTMYVTNNSIQDFVVWACDSLIAHTTKQGCVLYKGSPIVHAKYEGTNVLMYFNDE